MKHRFLKIWAFALWSVLFFSSSFAGTYYVSPTGSAPWSGTGNCTAEGTPCSISTANTSAVAGDTIILKSGTYTASGSIINPTYSGNVGSPITYRSQIQYGAVIKSTADHTIALNAKSYIVIDGIFVKRDGDFSWVRFGTSGTNDTVQNCKFRTDDTSNTAIAGIGCYSTASYIKILNNDILDGYGSNPSPTDTVVLRADAGDIISHFLIQGNQVQGGGHSGVSIMRQSASGSIQYVVIKDNDISNPNHRSLEIGETYEPEYIVIDNNIIRDAGEVCDDNGNLTECSENVHGSESDKAAPRSYHNNLQWHANYGIVRKNRMYKGGKMLNSGWELSSYNRFYNNTFYKHGLGIYVNGSGVQTDNVWVNNAFVDTDLTVEAGVTNRHFYYDDTASPCVNTWRHNNFDGSQGFYYNACPEYGSWGSELFSEIITRTGWVGGGNTNLSSGFTSKTNYIFVLAASSALIDSGGWLTTTVGSGSGISLTVADARYFYDGYGLVTGDTIQLGGSSETAVISSINYETNVITLVSPGFTSWANGVGVSLSYSGNAPDIGAFESGTPEGRISYYISATGDDNNNGKSPATAWQTINKVRSYSSSPGFNSGDRVYFRCGDTFTPSDTLYPWEGSLGAPTIIGAYYMDGGIPIYGVSGTRPIIDGQDYSVPPNLYHGGASNSYRGLIQISGPKNYIQIKNLILRKSGFFGIHIYANPSRTEAGTPKYWIIDNVKTEGSWSSGISMLYLNHAYGTVQNCEVMNYAMDYGSDHPVVAGDWAAGMPVAHSPYANVTIQNNYIHHGWGEAINIFCNPTASNEHHGHVTVQDNIIFCSRRVSIYVDNAEYVTVRRNMLLGAGPPEIENIPSPAVRTFQSISYDGRGWNQNGIYIDQELGGKTQAEAAVSAYWFHHVYIYNNFIAGFVTGIGMGSQISTVYRDNVHFQNNTFIGNRTNLSATDTTYHSYTNSTIKNNISYVPADGAALYTTWRDTISTSFWSKFDADYNSWTNAVNVELSGAHDKVTNAAFQKTTGWHSLQAPCSTSDFKTLITSTAIDAGVSLATYFTTDFFGITRPMISAWDIGAFEYISELNLRIIDSSVISGTYK